jgi:protein TonB
VLAAFLLVMTGAAQAETVRITEADAKKAVVNRIDPEYPPMARQLRLSGRVQLDVYIDEDGRVEKTEGVAGNPMLTNAAANAVKKWKFTPVMSGGKPSKAVAGFSFDFKM